MAFGGKIEGGISMKKAIVTMNEWVLYVHDGKYNLSGIADNHPKIGRNQFVAHTSSLQSGLLFPRKG